MSKSPCKGTALVTGASTGIGAVYADRLAKRGYDLILVARNEARLNALAAHLVAETGRSVTPLQADLGHNTDLAKVESLLRTDPAITMLVNNAGTAAITPLLQTDVDKTGGLIALNITAPTRLTYAAAPAFVARRTGTIINISSVVGISPETLNGVYGATKAYVLALSHSLQHELADKGIRIQAVLPAATATDLWEKAGLPHQNLPSEIVMSPEDVVDAALAGLDQGELVTLPSLQDGDEWNRFEAARRAISAHFGNSTPAPRYRVGARATASGSPDTESKNKALVLEAFDTLFNKRDYAAAERFWSPNYIQHSAHIAPGRDGLFNLIKSIPPTLKYEPGTIVADGEFVIVHGRFSGIGLPVNWIAADILRIQGGVFVEHWDVIQDEATRESSKSGLPMFGDKFTETAAESDRSAAAS